MGFDEVRVVDEVVDERRLFVRELLLDDLCALSEGGEKYEVSFIEWFIRETVHGGVSKTEEILIRRNTEEFALVEQHLCGELLAKTCVQQVENLAGTLHGFIRE